MHSFKSFLAEKVLSIGLNPEHEKFREKHRQQIHDVIQHSYKNVDGGYGGNGSGTKKESDAIHDDITHSVIKATKRGDKITAVNLYKKQHGRKSIASGTDGSEQGKNDWKKTKLEDNTKKRSWGEVSGAAEHLQRKIGVPVIKNNVVGKLLNKHIEKDEDGEHYTRDIGGQKHRKVAMGHYTKSDE
jgi:hypothetical protein